ncbi:MAG: SGNH/GDSL hydrolase family protein [Clostridia bacterium]|nr:SGNH/GDSL hydrolase family protein [Clostridia bacterium]
MKILFFGDSITDMSRKRDADGDVHSYGSGYVFLVTSKLLADNPTKYEIINRGNSGNRVVDLYARIKKDVWNECPDILSILIGVNDVWHELSENPNGVELARWEKVYRMLIEDTRERLPNTKIMILEPFVLHGRATDFDDKYEDFQQVKSYAAKARELAEEYGLTFVPLQEKFDEAAEKYGEQYYLYDGVHPDVAGAALIAGEWLKAFEKMEKQQ